MFRQPVYANEPQPAVLDIINKQEILVMIRKFLTVALSMMLLQVSQLASADDFDDCQAACIKGYPECIANITEVNYNEVLEAKAKCQTDKTSCIENCHKDDAKAQQEIQDKAQQELQDKAPQEQPVNENINGNIKVYEFK